MQSAVRYAAKDAVNAFCKAFNFCSHAHTQSTHTGTQHTLHKRVHINA